MTKSNKIFANFLITAFLLVLVLPVVGLANPPQGRGRGRERKSERVIRDRDFDDCRGCWDNRERRRNLDKKEEKFINGHDARDGRWDGRGPKSKSRRLPPRRYFR